MVNDCNRRIHRNKLNIIYLNIRSLRNKLNEIKLICQQKNPDIVALNEIWIDSNETKFYQMEGYLSIFNCRDEREGGGCGMFIKSDLRIKQITLLRNFFNIIGI